MNDCIFCKIVKGEIPSYKVYEDENSLAFLDINPHSKGHTVVIPKTHGVTVFEITSQNLNTLFEAVKSAMDKIEKVLKPDGYNVGWNHGASAGQVVPHIHIHIFPRYAGDGGGNMHSIIKNPGDLSVDEVYKLFEL